jgi:hypothetical protein
MKWDAMSFGLGPGLPDFFDTIYQKGGKYAKFLQNYPMAICKRYQMAIIHSIWP